MKDFFNKKKHKALIWGGGRMAMYIYIYIYIYIYTYIGSKNQLYVVSAFSLITLGIARSDVSKLRPKASDSGAKTQKIDRMR